MISKTLTILALGMLLCGTAPAAPEHKHDVGHDHGHNEQRAHVHGLASLAVVVNGNTLHIEFDSPAANILGFEHAPASRQEQQAAAVALAHLRDGAGLFRPTPGADCRQIGVDIYAPQLEPNPPSGPHADIRAEYRFACGATDALASIETRLFDAFPALQELRVQFIARAGQGGTRLTPSRAILKLR